MSVPADRPVEDSASVSGILSGYLARLRSFLPTTGARPITPVSPPVDVTDREGRSIVISDLAATPSADLFAMYEAFDPAERAQGIPPTESDAIREWLQTIQQGSHVVATHADRTVGHVAVVPDGDGTHELAIFVHQDYQGAGIGSVLLSAGLGQARAKGVGLVWIFVEADNHRLHTFYRRAGFTVTDSSGPAYRMSMTFVSDESDRWR